MSYLTFDDLPFNKRPDPEENDLAEREARTSSL